MTTKTATSKKKAAPKKKPSGKTTGKAVTAKQRHKRNKNDLTPQEQAFADALMANKDGKTATDLVLENNPHMSRPSARSKASNWMKCPRINKYMDVMRDRVEDAVEYGLVQWRKDVLELIDIAMGRKERVQVVTMKDEKTGKQIKLQLDGVKEFEGAVAKAGLELIAKQMKLLTDKVEVGGNEDQPMHWIVDVVRPDEKA